MTYKERYKKIVNISIDLETSNDNYYPIYVKGLHSLMEISHKDYFNFNIL